MDGEAAQTLQLGQEPLPCSCFFFGPRRNVYSGQVDALQTERDSAKWFQQGKNPPQNPKPKPKAPLSHHLLCVVLGVPFLDPKSEGVSRKYFFFAEVSLCVGKKRGEKRLFSSKQSASLSALTFPRAEGSPNPPGAGSGGPSSLGATRTDPGPIPAPHPLPSQPCSGALGSFCAFLQQLPGARGREPLCGLDALFPLWNLLLLSQSAVPGGEEALAQ